MKGNNITQYLTFEGIYAIGQEALLVDAKIASLVEPSNGVWLQVRHYQKGHPLDDLW
jgi:hypothetical protein